MVDASRIMLKILTTDKAAIAVARRYSIPCAVRQPRCSGPNRCTYRQRLCENAAAADGTLFLGNSVPPFNADVRAVLECGKPATSVATRVALRFPNGTASTRKWLLKNQIKTLTYILN